ncbi:hypothetical protein HKX48_000328 [Thoreauomyces humboldtii]|nr:hypothetical protein HKX48_000328 [Thoreauomyces humboldtii]
MGTETLTVTYAPHIEPAEPIRDLADELFGGAINSLGHSLTRQTPSVFPGGYKITSEYESPDGVTSTETLELKEADDASNTSAKKLLEDLKSKFQTTRKNLTFKYCIKNDILVEDDVLYYSGKNAKVKGTLLATSAGLQIRCEKRDPVTDALISGPAKDVPTFSAFVKEGTGGYSGGSQYSGEKFLVSFTGKLRPILYEDFRQLVLIGRSRAELIKEVIEQKKETGIDGIVESMSKINVADSVTDQEGASTVTENQAKFYYAGVPSGPRLIASTSASKYSAPSGPEAYRVLKTLRAVGNHSIASVWEDNLAFGIHSLLERENVAWTSTDVVRIGVAQEKNAPVILWIGVLPDSLSFEAGRKVVSACQVLLRTHRDVDLSDVVVEIRESKVFRSGGPHLLLPGLSSDPTATVREPFTASVGLSITACSKPDTAGTLGLFLASSHPEKIYAITARHVVLPLDDTVRERFESKTSSQSRKDVWLLGEPTFKERLASIEHEIVIQAEVANRCGLRIKAMSNRADQDADYESAEARFYQARACKAIQKLKEFHETIKSEWGDPGARVLGDVCYAPPIVTGAGAEKYTQDFAVIQIHPDKLNHCNFDRGNVMDLGNAISPEEFTRRMYPNATSPFAFPTDRLLPIRGTIPIQELRNPLSRDRNDDPCLPVIKNGHKTGVTIGLANNICSYSRGYYHHVTKKPLCETQTSKEWAILPWDHHSGAFSASGDSGSTVVDGRGRVGGVLTGGAGLTDSLDITYVTPFEVVMEKIHAYPPLHDLCIHPGMSSAEA